MPITPGRGGVRRVAQHCRCSWWNDHVSLRMTLCDGPIDILLVVGAIADEGGEWTGDLVEQGLGLRAIIDLMGPQLRREDLPGLGIDSNVQLAPGSAPLGPVFLDQPLAGSAKAKTCAVRQQVNRAFRATIWLCRLEGFGAPAQGRVIRGRQIETEELEDRADQAFGLAQGQPEHRPQGQGCLDRQS